MIKNKKALIILWGIAFALTLFLVLIIPAQITGTAIVALVFDCVGFISQLILWLNLAREKQSAKDVFGNAPAAVVSCVYLAILFVLSILCSAFPNVFYIKTAVIVDVIIMAAAWLLLVSLLGGKSHIQRVDSRQRDHHIELKREDL